MSCSLATSAGGKKVLTGLGGSVTTHQERLHSVQEDQRAQAGQV